MERFDPSTSSINLSDKRIGLIDLSHLIQCPNLEVLTLSGNEIQNLDLSVLTGNKHLLELNLGSNELEIIDLSPLKDITDIIHLDLSFNRLKSINLTPLGSCKNLNKVAESYSGRNRILGYWTTYSGVYYVKIQVYHTVEQGSVSGDYYDVHIMTTLS